IEVRLNNKATEILKDKDGKVTGVKAVDKEGKEYTLDAKAVVLATGGFGANKEMVVKYQPGLKGFATTNQPGATGDGIVMAEKLGADFVDM
ncbi:MAG TPA: flavocytochrome c, partial [Clostridiaceae bacterium]|nr:flavocytochrome c [Clostridiaceae bacterium]